MWGLGAEGLGFRLQEVKRIRLLRSYRTSGPWKLPGKCPGLCVEIVRAYGFRSKVYLDPKETSLFGGSLNMISLYKSLKR